LDKGGRPWMGGGSATTAWGGGQPLDGEGNHWMGEGGGQTLEWGGTTGWRGGGCGKTLEWRGGQPLETAKRKIPDQLLERVKICNFKAKTSSIINLDI
jgi:hypothetical protein